MGLLLVKTGQILLPEGKGEHPFSSSFLKEIKSLRLTSHEDLGGIFCKYGQERKKKVVLGTCLKTGAHH